MNSGDTAWVLVCAAMVFLMTPGLAFFYGGMVRSRHVVSTMYQTFFAVGVVGILWTVLGYSLAFGDDHAGLVGGLNHFLLNGVDQEAKGSIPHIAFMLFQGMFAVICPALLVGAFAERVSFKAWLLIMGSWSIFVYAPVCHWVWGAGGWISTHGGLDFAGGLVVHTTAGVAGLVAAMMFGRRKDFGAKTRPHDTGLVLLGTGLLTFGWFGFNAGSALTASGLAAHAAATTFMGAASAMVGWTLVDWNRKGKPSALGSAIGMVVGLVAITPAAGYVSIPASLFIGAVCGIACNIIAEVMKEKLRLDDTLDVFACHGVGGILGALFTGVFASKAINPAGADGLIFGNIEPLIANLYGVVAVAGFAAVATFVIIKVVNAITPIRVSFEEEKSGLDTTQHNETINAALEFFHHQQTSARVPEGRTKEKANG